MRYLREPLLHFLAFGVVVFVAQAVMAGEPIDEAGRDEVVVSASLVAALTPAGQGEDERSAALDAWIRDEVLLREARRLGLDEGDVIVRRRLVQKMEFLIEGLAQVEEPEEATLERFYTEHAERYRAGSRMSFVHVFYARDERDDARRDAEQALRELDRNQPSGGGLGDPFVAGRVFERWDRARVEGRFGAAFAEELAAMETGLWAGPVESSFGWHLVRVTDRTAGGTRPLDEVRDIVRRELMTEARESAYQRAVDELVGRYPVRVESAGSEADRS